MVCKHQIDQWFTNGVKKMNAPSTKTKRHLKKKMQKNIRKKKMKKVQWKDPIKQIYTFKTEEPADRIRVTNYNLNDLWLATSPDADLFSFVDLYWPDKYVCTQTLLNEQFNLHCYESLSDF